MGRLTRDQIVAQVDLRTEVVEVPEWGGSVVVRELSGRERDVFESSIVKRNGQKMSVDMENMRARFVAACGTGGDARQTFYPRDVGRLGELSAAALERVFSVGRRLAGMTGQDVDELTKN